MQTSNPIPQRHARRYHLTPAGAKLAAYLDYVDGHPGVSSNLNFGDARPPAPPAAVPEQFDDDRQPEEQSLEDAGYDGMGGTPWDDGFDERDRDEGE